MGHLDGHAEVVAHELAGGAAAAASAARTRQVGRLILTLLQQPQHSQRLLPARNYPHPQQKLTCASSYRINSDGFNQESASTSIGPGQTTPGQ